MTCHGASAGVLITRGERLLLVKRRWGTPGWACPAGHVDLGETLAEAAAREVREEVGLSIDPLRLGKPVLVAAGLIDRCSRGTPQHDWAVFTAEVDGQDPVRCEEETLDMGWWSREELAVLARRDDPGLEPVWGYMLTRLGWIK